MPESETHFQPTEPEGSIPISVGVNRGRTRFFAKLWGGVALASVAGTVWELQQSPVYGDILSFGLVATVITATASVAFHLRSRSEN